MHYQLCYAPSLITWLARLLHDLGDDARASTLLDDVAAMSLGSDDRAALADELGRADELRVALA